LDEGDFTEGPELDSKWKVAKEMVGRRLSQAEAKRLLAKLEKRIGAATPSSGVAEVSAAHRALLGHTV
jgi:hypothetical protein